MTDKKTTEENILIAEFMGWKKSPVHGWLRPNHNASWRYGHDEILNFNSSWDWLLPVVEKIETGDYGFKMCRKVVEVYIDSTKETFIRTKEASRIQSLFKAVVEFIQLRNKFAESQNQQK